MDTREKFNIKQMFDCERQEPFYPVTHAQAVKIIDNGEVKNLQDIISVLLEFVNNFNGFSPTDLVQLGYEHYQAFFGDEGRLLQIQMATIYPASSSIIPLDISNPGNGYQTKPITSKAFLDYLSNWVLDIVDEGYTQPVSSEAVYNYVQSFILEFTNGIIGPVNTLNTDKGVSGSTVYDYLYNDYFPNGTISSNDNKPVSGKTVHDYLQGVEKVWKTVDGKEGSIKQVLPNDENALGLNVLNSNEVAIGKFNISNQKGTLSSGNTVFSVGIGSSNNSRANGIEIKNSISDTIYFPYESSYISIQHHIRNGQNDVKHLTSYQLDKLIALINEKWKASWSFSLSGNGGLYYHNNTGIKLSWDIKNSENNNNVTLNQATIFQQQGSNNFVNLGVNITEPRSEYTISDYSAQPILMNFNSSGQSTFTFKMNIQTNELNDSSTKSISLYAPVYVFCSSNDNIQSLDSLPNNCKTFGITSKSQFQVSNVTIDSNQQQYIYIALPQFIGLTQPNPTNQPFKDDDSGFEFSLSNSYFVTTTKSTTLRNKQITTNYNIVRSDQLLTAGSTWKIKSK